MHGVIDRIESGKIVILDEENKVEYLVRLSEVSVNCNEGDWLELIVHNGELIQFYKDDKLTSKKRKSIKKRIEKLRGNKSKYKNE